MVNKQNEREKKLSEKLVDGYEHNLSLLLDTLKVEHQDINKDKVTQYGNFKTIMWLNIVFIGISVKILEYITPVIWGYILFIIFSGLSILFSLIAMIESKHNAYTSIGRPKRMANIPNDKWIKAQGYLTIIYAYRKVIKYNGIKLIRHGRWLRRSKWTTLSSFLLLVFLSLNILELDKGESMSDKNTPPVQPIVKPITGKRSNESAEVSPTKMGDNFPKPADKKK